MQSITHYNFRGTNLIDDNLSANISPYSLNTDTETGVASKRRGIASLFDSLGATGIHSLYDAKLNSTNTLVLGHGTSAYKLSGSAKAITKNDKAGFELGTLTNTNASTDVVLLNFDRRINSYTNPNSAPSPIGAFDSIGHTWPNPSVESLKGFTIWMETEEITTMTLSLYTSPGKEVLLGTATTPSDSQYKAFSFIFDDAIPIIASSYYFEITAETGRIIFYRTTSGSANGIGYGDGSILGTNKLSFATIILSFQQTGSYISETIDFGGTPSSNVITFNETIQPNTTLTVSVSGSNDNTTWTSYVNVDDEDPVMLTRYMKVKAELTTSDDFATPVLQDFTLTYQMGIIKKTTTADFEEGTLNSNTTVNDNISILEYARSQYDFTSQAEYDAWTVADNISYGSGSSGGIEYADDSIHFYAQSGAGEDGSVGHQIATISTDLTYIDSIIINYNFTLTKGDNGSVVTSYFKIDDVTKYGSMTPGTHTSTIDVSAITGTCELKFDFYVIGDPAFDFDAYVDDIKFEADSYTNDAEYVSQSLDLGQTPEANKITFNKTEYTGQTVQAYTRGSHDNAIWGQWELKSSNDSIPLTRYIQVKCVIPNSTDYVSHLTKPSLSDYTITYTPIFDSVLAFDTMLSGNIVRWQNYLDILYYTDGGQPKRYDGTTVSTAGTDAPSTGCTVSVGSANGLTGVYYYKITYINSNDVESNPSPASESISVTNQKISLTNIPTETGMNRNIYRTLAGGSVYYYVATIEDDTTTTYTDSTDDTTIEVSSGLLQTDNSKPPASTIIYEYKNHMFYVSTAYPNRLYFSKAYGSNASFPLAGLEEVPDTNWKELPDTITGLKGYQNKLIVTGETFTGFFTGNVWGGENDDTSWYLVDDIGAIRHEAIEICQSLDGAICVLGTKYGIKYFIPSIYENGLEKLPLSYDVQPYFDGGILDNMWLKFYNSRLFVGFIYSEGTPITYNNSVLVYDFKRRVWDGLWTLNMNTAIVFNGLLYGGGSNIGKVYEMLSGHDDDGQGIHMIHDFKGDLGKYRGTIQRLKIQATTTSTTDDLEIKFQVDGNELTLPTGDNTLWRKSATSFGKQDLMERVLSVKRRGTFYGCRIDDNSTNSVDVSKVIIEFEGVKE